MRFTLTCDATTTRGDFVRLPPQATGGAQFREVDGRFCGGG